MLSLQGYLGRVSDKSVHFFLLYNVLQILSKGNLNSNTIPRRPSPQHTHCRNESAPGEASGSFSLISHRTSSDSHTVTHAEPFQSRRAHPAAFCNPSPSEKRPCLPLGFKGLPSWPWAPMTPAHHSPALPALWHFQGWPSDGLGFEGSPVSLNCQ